jgi:mono/diheme cytochrome c family protein
MESQTMVFRLKVVAVALGCSLGMLSSVASAQPFPTGVVAKGQALHASKCVSCHNSMAPDGKGDELYSEFARKMTNAAQLKGMVEFCANRTRSGWFEEEINHVSRYLNDTYYKFK